MTLLNKNRINALLPHWSYRTKQGCYDYIQRKVVFPSFSQATTFLRDMLLQNEKMNHHCKYTSDYTKVKMKIYTHTAKGVTEKDVAFANVVDSALNNYAYEEVKASHSGGKRDT
ncbi:4a-hydroxytetrahydrobiopterin dehydratase [Plasmodium inui San Antonio 1]|uniref:4a-hydroxytetrahydrobiopterin dehydratase n=1 Tax=Plasmodium inui San Antonio 1 TaxID=1237626 RepID=W7A2J1_9APIC|nr:4a-hydroxytetrahydrobiopterin dehydratase [Plasmodium inui San Antonio 1]EUD65548.1 4a-hydroxytetrahydrobiopterin dehydratase [Plasmodium inui San Antonio 1]